MLTVFLVIDVILAISLVALVLVQRSDGALGSIGGGASSIMTTRSKGNFLTRTTAIIAAAFMACSLVLCIISKPEAKETVSVLNSNEPIKNDISVPLTDMEVNVETEVETTSENAAEKVENAVKEEVAAAETAIKQEAKVVEEAVKEEAAKVENKVTSAADNAAGEVKKAATDAVNSAEYDAKADISNAVNSVDADVKSAMDNATK